MSSICCKINSIFLLHHHSPYITTLKDDVLRRIWIKQPIKLLALADSSYQQVTNVKPHKITKRYDLYQEKLDSIEFYKSVNP